LHVVLLLPEEILRYLRYYHSSNYLPSIGLI
jgi:hypothetical protein